jgi:hypothetical protein
MVRLKSFLAHAWVLLATPIVLATFVGMPFFSSAFARGTGLKVSPWFVGGDVLRETPHDGYRVVLRKPVFEGLIGQRSTGFVQVEWLPAEGASLPPALHEPIDYDGDGTADFTVDLDTGSNQAAITAHSPRVLGIERVYSLTRERVIRVRLRRE